jgi:zinc/manganese transport system substrate-binding protein
LTAYAAGLQVVTTTGNLGALTREVGGDKVQVTVLAPADQDLCSLAPSPAVVRVLRAADLLIALGNGIEDLWLPAAIAEASNPHDLSAGRPRRLDAALVPGQSPSAIGGPTPAPAMEQTRIDLDPVRMGAFGRALGRRLAEIDPAHGPRYLQRADAFAADLLTRLPQWQRQTRNAAGVILYSGAPVPLVERFGIPLLAVMETAPGVAPAGADLADLLARMRNKRGLVLVTTDAPPKTPRLLAQRLDWRMLTLPLDPRPLADGGAYLDHVARWVDAMTLAQTPAKDDSASGKAAPGPAEP